jgi:hypothetical protein
MKQDSPLTSLAEGAYGKDEHHECRNASHIVFSLIRFF